MKQKLNAKILRHQKPTPKELKKITRQPIYIILDNVLDTYNIGAIFRLADAVAAQEVIICDRSQTPQRSDKAIKEGGSRLKGFCYRTIRPKLRLSSGKLFVPFSVDSWQRNLWC